MANYREILVAIDLSGEAEQLLSRAQEEARLHGARLSLVHVVRPFTHVYGGIGAADYSGRLAMLEVELQNDARRRLGEIASANGIPSDRAHTLLGSPAIEIRQLCNTRKHDLLVIGTHGRHGLGLLLGSTANAALHGLAIDALVVRIRFD